MAALKLITLGGRPLLRISSSNGTTRRHCPLFSQAEMVTLGKRPCCTSQRAMAALKLTKPGNRP
eukprot:2815761-Karenia_brevis.AAC.1